MPRLSPKSDMCFSGGTDGADSAWENIAHSNGHYTTIISFDGHHSATDPVHGKMNVIPKNELKKADKYLDEANIYLNRKNYKQNLIRRNYFVIENVSKCYAVVIDIHEKTKTSKHKPRLVGNTAWGCTMFILKHIKKQDDKRNVPLYIYIENKELWVTPLLTVENGKITDLEYVETDPPKPCGQYAGIGTRDITQVGKNAIRELFNKE